MGYGGVHRHQISKSTILAMMKAPIPIQISPPPPATISRWVLEEIEHVVVVDEPDHPEHDERQRADDQRRGLGFGRHRLDLELHLAALAQHVGEVGERLGKVAAGFALDRDGDDEKLEFGGAEPVRGLLERGIERAADLHLVRDRAEFVADRAVDLGTDDADRLGDRQARAQPADEQFDRVGEFGGGTWRSGA